MLKFFLSLLFCLFCFLPAPAQPTKQRDLKPKLQASIKDLEIEQQIQQMSEEEKIAQLIIIGVQSQKQYDRIFKVFFPGGFVDYRSFKTKQDFNRSWFENLDALQALSLKKTGRLSLYMANQEGGEISRFKSPLFSLPQPENSYPEQSDWDMPGPLKLASANNLKLVEDFAFVTGKMLLLLGINMNLAPVVDIFNPAIDGYIRGRSFSSDPEEVQQNSRAFTAGLQKAGVIATFKHFPGYSNSVLNSHKKLVTIDFSKKDFKEKHGLPYQWGRGSSYPQALMSNIAFYPQLDPQSTAPLSKKIITGLLKQELGYKGLILTDDIGMEGFKEPDPAKRAIKAFVAGHDMILLSVVPVSTVIRIYKELGQAFKQGRIPKSHVHESLKKVLKLKAGLSHSPKDFSQRLKSIEKLQSQLYQINKKLTLSMRDNFFKKNPHLIGSLSPQTTILSFSSASGQAIENLKFFNKHEKKFQYVTNKRPEKALKLSKTRLGFCYGKLAKACHQHFSKAQKKHIILIDTRNKPLAKPFRKDYKIYIPTYGLFPGVGEMFLKVLIGKPTPTQLKN